MAGIIQIACFVFKYTDFKNCLHINSPNVEFIEILFDFNCELLEICGIVFGNVYCDIIKHDCGTDDNSKYVQSNMELGGAYSGNAIVCVCVCSAQIGANKTRIAGAPSSLFHKRQSYVKCRR